MRTFVALEIDSNEVLESIGRIQSELKIKAKPISSKNIHFTLFFLGEISDSISKKVQEALGSIEFQPFEVSIIGVGAFPKPRIPRIIWVGTDNEGGKKITNLASVVEEKLSIFGFQKDKPFKPHATIFRVKNRIENISDELKKLETYSFGVQKISEIKFKKSVLTYDGPLYSDLQVVKAK